jgi:DNA/RNA-binding protein KIN17
MVAYNEDPDSFTEKFSREFEQEFLQILNTRYQNTRVLANRVYSELIANREHIHMNSTRWTTLAEFSEHLRE